MPNVAPLVNIFFRILQNIFQDTQAAPKNIHARDALSTSNRQTLSIKNPQLKLICVRLT
jgi:hypothetical protein